MLAWDWAELENMLLSGAVVTSMSLCRTWNIQETFGERLESVQGTFSGTFGEHSGNVQGTFKDERSRNIQGILSHIHEHAVEA
jgi:hypothetical protein